MAVDYSIIGSRIKEARRNKNMTQEELADKLDVSVAFLSRVERGNSQVNLKRINEISNLLDVTESYILDGTSNNNDRYLNKEFADILQKLSPEKQKMVYKIARVIAGEDEA